MTAAVTSKSAQTKMPLKRERSDNQILPQFVFYLKRNADAQNTFCIKHAFSGKLFDFDL
jgi:hypothetical protein